MTEAEAGYDPEARRDTPLALELKKRIRCDGPMPVAEYMRVCLQDSEHGYYRTRAAIGRGGDFVTAPEISQIFGELIGLWCAVVWQQVGEPAPFNLVELGPGRGTMMRDALRAMRRVPGCLAAARVRLVEIDPALEALQRQALGDAGAEVSWHRSAGGDIPRLPTIAVANELIDAQPVAQRIRAGEGWAERVVALDALGRLVFARGAVGPWDYGHRFARSPEGTIAEARPFDGCIAALLHAMPAAVVLAIDYGHAQSGAGDTLQAVREHRFEHPLTSPGEADLSSQVDFELLAAQARDAGSDVDGPITQGEFLSRLGIVERASRLMGANPALAGEIEAGVARLLSPQGMGTRFKAIGIRSSGLAILPGLEQTGSRQ